MEFSDIIKLNKSHIKPAAEVLVKAFQTYPLLRHCFPNEQELREVAYYFFQVTLNYSIHYGEAYATSPDMEGIAIWVHSDKLPMTVWKVLRAVPLSVILGFGRKGSGRMKRSSDYIDARHERLAPEKHWYLQVIGVNPQFQGKGYSGKLIRPMLKRIDQEDIPCYLETLDERNVGIYEHFGFEMIEKSPIPKTSLTNWAMLRRAI
ncbi:MAG: GNAT family N-acetyltransferase [Dehalococcoidia bacterium]|nr:MAG: GNAT family N-acetyltransferase [Dehalococcoidia bacterium]